MPDGPDGLPAGLAGVGGGEGSGPLLGTAAVPEGVPRVVGFGVLLLLLLLLGFRAEGTRGQHLGDPLLQAVVGITLRHPRRFYK